MSSLSADRKEKPGLPDLLRKSFFKEAMLTRKGKVYFVKLKAQRKSYFFSYKWISLCLERAIQVDNEVSFILH